MAEIQVKTDISVYALQSEDHPDNLINYARKANDENLFEKILEVLKKRKPTVIFLEKDGELVHYARKDDLCVFSVVSVDDVCYCRDCPHGIPEYFYVTCKRDWRRMSPFDFCSLSNDSDLYPSHGKLHSIDKAFEKGE